MHSFLPCDDTAHGDQNPRSRVDRFRGRLVVPIRDHRGTVIGFGARDLSDSQVRRYIPCGYVQAHGVGDGVMFVSQKKGKSHTQKQTDEHDKRHSFVMPSLQSHPKPSHCFAEYRKT